MQQRVLALQDPDVGVAQQAASALCTLAQDPAKLQLFLSQEGCLLGLTALSVHKDAVVRSRYSSCLIGFAAVSPASAELVVNAGAQF
jgi:hypothetical protein